MTSTSDHAPVPSAAPIGRPAERTLRGVAAAVSVGAAGVHFAMAPEHFREYWLFGTFFVASAWAQLAWAAAVVLRPGRQVFQLGALGQAAVIVLWVVTRTTGLPIGPDHWSAEPVAAVDTLCSTLELVALLAALALLRPAWSRRLLPDRVGTGLVAGATALVLGVTVFALTPSAQPGGGSAAATTATGMAGMPGMPAAPAKAVAAVTSHRPGTASAAAVATAGTTEVMGMSVPVLASGPLAGSAVVGCMMRQMHEVGHGAGACTSAPVTALQVAAAQALVVATRAAVVNLPTLKTAYAAGYVDANVSGPLYHVVKTAYLLDGKMLDPSAIESLVYFKAPTGGSMLLGAMYVATPGEAGPLVGGALTPWHSHTNLCVNPGTGTAFNRRADGTCAPGSAVAPTPQMLHVWTVPYPGGPFAELDAGPLTQAVIGAIRARGGMPTGT